MLPNALSLVRLCAVPVFALLWLHGHLVPALWVFVGAAVTDLLDGFAARLFDQQTALGALLDPLADKCMLLVAWVVAALTGVVLPWIAILVVGRDVVLGFGALLFGVLWRNRHAPSKWRPTRLGKYAVALQAITIALAILDAALHPPGLNALLAPLMLIAALLGLVSLGQYILRAIRAAWPAALPAANRVMGPEGRGS